jgi:hypothetical protein
MAKNTHTPRMEIKTLTQDEIEALAEHLAAQATSRSTKNQIAKNKLLLAASLLSMMSFEHPNGLTVEVFSLRSPLR